MNHILAKTKSIRVTDGTGRLVGAATDNWEAPPMMEQIQEQQNEDEAL